MPAGAQVAFAKDWFERQGIPAETIDVAAYIDRSLSYEENIKNLRRQFGAGKRGMDAPKVARGMTAAECDVAIGNFEDGYNGMSARDACTCGYQDACEVSGKRKPATRKPAAKPAAKPEKQPKKTAATKTRKPKATTTTKKPPKAAATKPKPRPTPGDDKPKTYSGHGNIKRRKLTANQKKILREKEVVEVVVDGCLKQVRSQNVRGGHFEWYRRSEKKRTAPSLRNYDRDEAVPASCRPSKKKGRMFEGDIGKFI